MIEIKFRFWHKKLKEMLQSHYISLNPHGQIYSNGLNITERFEIMQYTGLKDKNGKEIYEGDVIKVNELTFKSSSPLPENLNVVFYMGSFQLFRGDECLMGLWLIYIKDGEIIGNIYENPELLEGKS